MFTKNEEQAKFPGREKNPMNSTQEIALGLCARVEPIAVSHNMHVALTGGCLYSVGNMPEQASRMQRKDIDILFYSHAPDRGPAPDFDGLLEDLVQTMQFKIFYNKGRIVKARWEGHILDIFLPERPFIDEMEDQDYGDY